MSEQNPFRSSRSFGRRPGWNPLNMPAPTPRKVSDPYDDDGGGDDPPESTIVTRANALAITGITDDTLRRWERQGLIWPMELVPGWRWYNVDDLRQIQRDMASRKGGRPVEGLGSFPDRAALDAEVDLQMARVVAALADRGVPPDAALRAVKRWTKNRP